MLKNLHNGRLGDREGIVLAANGDAGNMLIVLASLVLALVLVAAERTAGTPPKNRAGRLQLAALRPVAQPASAR